MKNRLITYNIDEDKLKQKATHENIIEGFYISEPWWSKRGYKNLVIGNYMYILNKKER